MSRICVPYHQTHIFIKVELLDTSSVMKAQTSAYWYLIPSSLYRVYQVTTLLIVK